MRKLKQGARIGGLVVCGGMVAFLLVPAFCGFWHGGMLFLLYFGLIGMALARPGMVQRLAPIGRGIYRMGVALLAVAGVLFAGLSVWMAAAAASPADPQAGTVIVLGCKVHGQEPSEMLRRRLDAALAWLEQHPGSDVIVTGGMGRDEDSTEAEVMRAYLIEHGAEPSRIYLEDKARNTAANLRFSADIIAAQGLDRRVVIVTDSWHQLRARLFAQAQALEASPLSCRTQWQFAPGYWCRELLALLRALLIGY